MATTKSPETAGAAAAETTAVVAETKSDKFKRLGNSRLGKALDAIGNLRGLANKANYEYTPDQVKALFTALEAEMTKLQTAFTSPDTAAAAPKVSIL